MAKSTPKSTRPIPSISGPKTLGEYARNECDCGGPKFRLKDCSNQEPTPMLTSCTREPEAQLLFQALNDLRNHAMNLNEEARSKLSPYVDDTKVSEKNECPVPNYRSKYFMEVLNSVAEIRNMVDSVRDFISQLEL